jgi:CelD/BcsL family acetyltransferase involved in cellulose biosynthesis
MAAVGVMAVVLLLASADTPVRGAFSALILLVAPGVAAAWLFREYPWPTSAAIAVAGTVVVNVTVAQVMIVADVWSPRGGVVAVAVLSGGLLAYGLGRPAAMAAGGGEAAEAQPIGRPLGTAPRDLSQPSRTNTLRVEVARPLELGKAECEQWHAMQRRDPHLGNPFLAAAFARSVDRFHDNARVAVLSTGPDIVGFFPFERHRFGIGRPIAAGLSDCQGLVHADGVELELDAHELVRRCGLSVFEFDHLVEGQAVFEPYVTTRAPSPVIDLSHGYGAFEALLRDGSPKFLRTTRSKARRLGRDVGELRFDDDVRDPDALRLVMGWKSAQYRRTGRSDRFARSWIVELVDYLLAADDPACSGALSMLYAGDQPIAGHFGLRSENVLAAWFPAYDVRVARYSPGLIQHLHMAEAAAASGIQVIDLGRGDREYKDSLKSSELTVAEGRVLRAAAPAAAAYWAARAPLRTGRNFVVTRPRLYRTVDRAMKRYGRVARGWTRRGT